MMSIVERKANLRIKIAKMIEHNEYELLRYREIYKDVDNINVECLEVLEEILLHFNPNGSPEQIKKDYDKSFNNYQNWKEKSKESNDT
jgi:hypothetical protein